MVSKVVRNRIGELIDGKQHRLDRTAEHFKDQLSWLQDNVFRSTSAAANPSEMSFNPLNGIRSRVENSKSEDGRSSHVVLLE